MVGRGRKPLDHQSQRSSTKAMSACEDSLRGMRDFGQQIESGGGLGLREDLDQCGAFDHFRQLILAF
jgi:hypothetical protein